MPEPDSLHIDAADEASLSACFGGSASAWLIEQKKEAVFVSAVL